MSENRDGNPRHPAIPAVVGIFAGGLASQLIPLPTFPKAICVGVIAAAVAMLVMAIGRPKSV